MIFSLDLHLQCNLFDIMNRKISKETNGPGNLEHTLLMSFFFNFAIHYIKTMMK